MVGKKADVAAADGPALFGNVNGDSSSMKKLSMIFIFHFMYFIIPAICIVTPPLILLFSSNMYLKSFVVVLVLLYLRTYDGSHKKSGRPWEWFVNTSLVRLVLEWLPVRLMRTAELDADKQYVFACHPHGTLAFNRAAVGFSTDTLWNAAFPGVKFRVLTGGECWY